MSNYLKHHGVLGMKWGVRRTPEQLARSRGKDISEDARTINKLKGKNVNQLSNAELRKLNERKQLESQYRQLNPSHVKKGLAFAATVAGVLSTAVTLYNSGSKVVSIGKNVGDKIIDVSGNAVMKNLSKGLSRG